MASGIPADDSRPWIAAAAALVALLAAVVMALWWGHWILSFDAFGLFSPYYTLVADFAAEGQLLLWEPWSNGGSPAHAYVEMGSFSPLTVLHAWLTGGGHLGFQLYWLSIWVIGGLGLLVLGRHLGAPVWGSLAVAISFGFSGFWLGHATHTSWLYAFSFLPWIVWRVDGALARERLWPCVEAGALYGLSALAGHPALVVLNGLFVGGWVMARLASQSSTPDPDAAAVRGLEPRTLARAALALATVVAVGGVVLSPAYAAFLVDAAGYADRVGALDRAIAVSDQRLFPSAIATIASPYLPMLKFADPALWPGTWVGLCANYVGPLIPALALLALFARPRSRFAGWIALLGLLNLACAVGDSLPLRGWLYDWVPPTRYFRHTAVMRGYFLFALGVLALLGSRELAADRAGAAATWKRLAWISGGLFVPMAIAYVATLGTAAALAPGIALGNAHFALAWLGAPCLFLLLARSPRLRSRSAVLLVGVAIADGLLGLVQSSPMMTFSYTGFTADAARRNRTLELARHGLWRDPDPRSALGNRHLPAKIPTVESFSTLNSRFHTRTGLGTASWHNVPESWSDVATLRRAISGDEDRTWFAADVVELAPTEPAFTAYVARAKALHALPIVVHARDAMLAAGALRSDTVTDTGALAQIAALPAARRIAVELSAYRPTQLAFSVDVPESGWLLVTDRWARGWRASVDGQPAEVWGGSFLFRALRVDSGRHEVDFRFVPYLHPWLWIASWGTLAAIALGCARARMFDRSALRS